MVQELEQYYSEFNFSVFVENLDSETEIEKKILIQKYIPLGFSFLGSLLTFFRLKSFFSSFLSWKAALNNNLLD